jgi:hypothetical protein
MVYESIASPPLPGGNGTPPNHLTFVMSCPSIDIEVGRADVEPEVTKITPVIDWPTEVR